ncbi:hypothetical protein MRX96_008164 [Rhipicephalus microplus]
MDSTSTTDAPPTVFSVDGKLPLFWTADPALWFIQVESQFAARRITADLTKYHYVVSSLPPAIASEIRNLLLAPPVENAYATLKETLIRPVTPSEPQRLQQLLHGTELGDRTPSQLLRHMQQLLGGTSNTIDGVLLRELYLQKLPSGVRMVIAASEHKDLTAAVELADKLVAMTPPTPMAAVQAQQPLNELQEMHPSELSSQISRQQDDFKNIQFKTECLEGFGMPSSEYAVVPHQKLLRSSPHDLVIEYRKRTLGDTDAVNSAVQLSEEEKNTIPKFIQASSAMLGIDTMVAIASCHFKAWRDYVFALGHLKT